MQRNQGPADDNRSEIAEKKLEPALEILTKLLPFAERDDSLGQAFQIALTKANAMAKGYIDANPGIASA